MGGPDFVTCAVCLRVCPFENVLLAQGFPLKNFASVADFLVGYKIVDSEPEIYLDEGCMNLAVQCDEFLELFSKKINQLKQLGADRRGQKRKCPDLKSIESTAVVNDNGRIPNGQVANKSKKVSKRSEHVEETDPSQKIGHSFRRLTDGDRVTYIVGDYFFERANSSPGMQDFLKCAKFHPKSGGCTARGVIENGKFFYAPHGEPDQCHNHAPSLIQWIGNKAKDPPEPAVVNSGLQKEDPVLHRYGNVLVSMKDVASQKGGNSSVGGGDVEEVSVDSDCKEDASFQDISMAMPALVGRGSQTSSCHSESPIVISPVESPLNTFDDQPAVELTLLENAIVPPTWLNLAVDEMVEGRFRLGQIWYSIILDDNGLVSRIVPLDEKKQLAPEFERPPPEGTSDPSSSFELFPLAKKLIGMTEEAKEEVICLGEAKDDVLCLEKAGDENFLKETTSKTRGSIVAKPVTRQASKSDESAGAKRCRRPESVVAKFSKLDTGLKIIKSPSNGVKTHPVIPKTKIINRTGKKSTPPIAQKKGLLTAVEVPDPDNALRSLLNVPVMDPSMWLDGPILDDDGGETPNTNQTMKQIRQALYSKKCRRKLDTWEEWKCILIVKLIFIAEATNGTVLQKDYRVRRFSKILEILHWIRPFKDCSDKEQRQARRDFLIRNFEANWPPSKTPSLDEIFDAIMVMSSEIERAFKSLNIG